MEFFLGVFSTVVFGGVVLLVGGYLVYQKMSYVPLDQFRLRIRGLLERGYHYSFLKFKDPADGFYFYVVKTIQGDQNFSLELWLPKFSRVEKLEEVKQLGPVFGLSRCKAPSEILNQRFVCLCVGTDVIFADEFINRALVQCYGYAANGRLQLSGDGISRELDKVTSKSQQPRAWDGESLLS